MSLPEEVLEERMRYSQEKLEKRGIGISVVVTLAKISYFAEIK